MCHGDLRTGIQIIKGFVQNQDGGIHQHGGNDANLLAVAVGEVVDEFAGPKDFAVHERFKALQAGAEDVVRNAVALGHKTKELFRRIELHQKTAVQIGPGEFFPGFVFTDTLATHGYIPAGGLDQIQHEAHEGCFAGTVVADKAHQFPFMECEFRDVQYRDTLVCFT